MRTRGGVQNCRTRDAAHTSHSQLKETMDNNAGSNEKQKDIMEKSAADSSEQQYVSIDNGNASKSSADINISETTAVDIVLEVITRVMIRLAMIPGQRTILL